MIKPIRCASVITVHNEKYIATNRVAPMMAFVISYGAKSQVHKHCFTRSSLSFLIFPFTGVFVNNDN